MEVRLADLINKIQIGKNKQAVTQKVYFLVTACLLYFYNKLGLKRWF